MGGHFSPFTYIWTWAGKPASITKKWHRDLETNTNNTISNRTSKTSTCFPFVLFFVFFLHHFYLSATPRCSANYKLQTPLNWSSFCVLISPWALTHWHCTLHYSFLSVLLSHQGSTPTASLSSPSNPPSPPTQVAPSPPGPSPTRPRATGLASDAL